MLRIENISFWNMLDVFKPKHKQTNSVLHSNISTINSIFSDKHQPCLDNSLLLSKETYFNENIPILIETQISYPISSLNISAPKLSYEIQLYSK